MKESQPQPQREAARFSDHVNRRSKDFSKKLQKITKKKLHSAFNSVSEKATDISKESVDFSAISEISDVGHIEDISDTLLLPEYSSHNFSDSTLSSKLLAGSDFELTSKMNSEIEKLGSTCADNFGSCHLKYTSLEEEFAIGLLRDAQSELRKSADVASKYKKLLDGLIDITVQEIHALPKERDHLAEILSRKTQVLFTFLLLWLIAVSAVLFFCSGMRRNYTGPLPT